MSLVSDATTYFTKHPEAIPIAVGLLQYLKMHPQSLVDLDREIIIAEANPELLDYAIMKLTQLIPVPVPVPVPHPLPPIPTREQVCGIRVTFQGQTVVTKQKGVLPWWGAALPWLDLPEDRQAVYAVQHAAGDTHSIAGCPDGFPLYDEINQPYHAGAFPALDWTNGKGTAPGLEIGPKCIALIIEQIRAGFVPMIFCDERYEYAINQIQPLMRALKHSPVGDLTPYCLVLPGWDGVFYGWEPTTRIMLWASLAREISPNCYLGMMGNPGHIPLGEGGADFLPGGRMKDFDVIMHEFNDPPDDNPEHGDDTVWQILGRMVRPYHRPADQPANDDPTPPFYLVDSSRGPRFYCAFEFGAKFGEYGWVRGHVTARQLDLRRQYLRRCGAKYTG